MSRTKWGKESKWLTFKSLFTRWFYPSPLADPNYWQAAKKEPERKGERTYERKKSN